MRHGSILVPFVVAATTAAFTPAQVQWWQHDFDSALTAAKDCKAGMVLLYCWHDPNPNCSAMFTGTLSDEKVTPVIGEFVCMGAKRNEDAGRQLVERFHVETVPTILFLDPAGGVVDVVAGYVPVADFLGEIARIKKGEGTVGGLREQAAAKPDDLALQLQLVNKLRATGDHKGSIAVIDAIVAKDEKLQDPHAAEAMLLKLIDEAFPADSAPEHWVTEPLYAFLRRQKNKRVLFLGYERLAAAEYQRDDLKAWAKFVERAWKGIPKDQVQDWGQGIATIGYRRWEDLDKIDKGILKLVLKISKAALGDIEKKQKQSPDKPFLAWAMYLHAAVLNVNNKRKDAFKLMDEAIALDPNNKDLKAAKDHWVAGNK